MTGRTSPRRSTRAVLSTTWVFALLVACGSFDGASDPSEGVDASADGASTDARCGDTTTSHDHCGACGHACATNERCFDGVCDGDKLVDVAADDGNACVVTKSGALYCWGANGFRQLGKDADAIAFSSKAVRVGGVSDAVQVSVGAGSICVLRRTGVVACWGLNDRGQLGHSVDSERCGASPCSATPTDVAGLPEQDAVAQVVVGGGEHYVFACARTTAGQVFCWGDNQRGTLGRSELDPPSSSVPRPVVGVERDAAYVSISGRAGNPAACALMKDATILCWGAAYAHNVGRDPSTANQSCTCFPTAGAPTLSGATGLVSVAVGDGATLALRGDFTVLAWGFPDYGVNPRSSESTVDSVPDAPKAVEVKAGFNHACARTEAGAVWCWGTNDKGQLGTGDLSGDQTCVGVPCWRRARQVADLTATRMALASRLTVAIQDHAAYAWGVATDGVLGHATALDRDCGGDRCAWSPTKVEGLPGAQ